MGNEEITEEKFFDIWKKVCKGKESELVKAWDKGGKKYSDVVLGHENSESVVCGIKNGLTGYDLQQEYYSCDVVYYKDEDFIEQNPLKKRNRKTPGNINGVWLTTIRIHLEHENDINTSWQEIAQLSVIPGCELNVLVTYPEFDDYKDLSRILDKYAKLLANRNTMKLLVVFGFLKEEVEKKIN